MGDRNERRKYQTAPVPGARVFPGTGRTDSEFINLELDKEQTVEFRQWREDLVNVLDIFTEEIESGYRFTIKYDERNSACACFMFPSDGTENAGYILTGRGSTAYRAIAECLFKHRELVKGVWVRAYSSGSRSDDPDF